MMTSMSEYNRNRDNNNEKLRGLYYSALYVANQALLRGALVQTA